MPSFRLPDGTMVEFPQGMDPETARRLVVAQFAGKHGLKKSAATQGSDVGSALTSGIANTLGIVPGLYGLLGGSYENAPLAGTVKSMREYAAKTETPETTYKKYLIDQAIANASKQGGVSGEAIETLKQLAVNPAITGLKLLEIIPDILVSVGTGGVGAAAGKAAVKAFAKETGEEAIKRGAARGAATGAIGTSAAQEGTSTGQEVYEETYRLLRAQGVTEERARAQAESAARGATIKQGLTVAALGKVLPGAEKAILGVGKGGVRRVAAGEAAEEGGTGISGQLIQNIAAGEIDPSIALSRGVGRAGAEGATLGALAGAGVGAFTRSPKTPEQVPPETKPADPVVDAAVKGLVDSGDVKPDEVVEADAAARLADIRKARAEAEKKAAAEAEKVEGEDELKAAEEKTAAATAVTPAEQAPATTEEDQLRAAETAGTTTTPAITDGTQTTQTQQAEAQGQEAPAATAATAAAPEVKTEEVPTEEPQITGAPSGTVTEGSGISIPVVGGTGGDTTATGTGAPATGGVGQTGVDAGEPAGGTAGEPGALKEKKPRKAKAVKEPLVEEGLTEEDIADEAAPVPTAYEKLDLADLEAKAAEVKSAPLAKAGEKIPTRANLRTFDVEIPVDQARLEEKLAGIRKKAEKDLTPAQRAIRWYGAYAEANGGAVKDIPRYLAHNRADPALASTGLPKKHLQPAITWLNSNLGGKVGSDIELAATKIQNRLKEAESQRLESDTGKSKRKGGRRKTVTEDNSTEATLIDIELEEKRGDLRLLRQAGKSKDVDSITQLEKEIAELKARKDALRSVSVTVTPEAKPILDAVKSYVDVPYTAGAFLRRMLNTKENKVLGIIADKIMQAGVNPGITYGPVPNGRPAMFDPKDGPNGTITIDLNRILKDRYDHTFKDPATFKDTREGRAASEAQQNILKRLFSDIDQLAQHELAHAGIDHMIDNPKTLSETQKTALAALKNIHGEVVEKLGKDTEYDIKDLKEFVAEAMSNPDFQNVLRKLETKKASTGGFLSAFSAFVNAVANAFGVRLNPESNTFVRTMAELEKLISAPTESRRGKSVSYAPADKKYVTIGNKRVEVETGTPEPTKKPKREKTPEQKAKQEAKQAAEAERIKNTIDVPKGWFQRTIRTVQNAQRPILLLEEALRKRGLLTPDYALNTEITLQSGASAARVQEQVKPLTDAYQDVLQKIAQKSKKELPEVLAQLDRYFVALTEPERRIAKFFEKASLTEAGERKRKLLFTAIVSNDTELKKLKKNHTAKEADADQLALIPDSMTVADAEKIYKAIEEIVLNDPEGALQDIDSSAFQTAGFRDDEGNSIPMTSDMSATIRKETEDYLKQNPEIGDLYRQAQDYQRKLDKLTQKLNREAGYGSPQLERLIAARNWKNYVPLRGAPETSEEDSSRYEYYGEEDAVSGTLIQAEKAAGGRKSAAENVIFRSFTEATLAATRPSRTNVTQVIRNLVEKGYLRGEINGVKGMKDAPSTFAERFIDGKKLERGDNLVYHYREDGLVDVITISDKDMARAIRNIYQNSNQYIDFLNSITSGMGQMHTRYNPSFWAKNFLADVLTNSFVFAAEEGKGSRYLWQVVSDLVDNKLASKGMNFIRLYEAGKTEEINKLAEKDSWYKDAQEYVRVGGKVSYVSGLSSAKQQEITYKSLGPGRIVRTKQQLDRLITPITDGLELAARVSAFRTYKSIPEYKDNPRAAAAASKNLANFENIGEKGKALGAWFMFFRPSATGGVRALDALMKGKHGKRTAALAIAGGAGIYALSQALSGEDDEGRNRVDTDDPDRWVRNWRIFIPGFKDPVQVPWGFGGGMLASMGAQIMMGLKGQSNFTQFVSNIISATKEGFIALPSSQINLIEYPAQWLMDTLAPSAARPLLQYAMNLDSLNREIFNKAFNRYSPMYVTKENMPESVNQFSKFIYDTYVDMTGSPPPFEQVMSPTGISFFMNNYLSAVYKGFGAIDGAVRWAFADGQATPDLIKSTMVLGAFKGTASNYDYRQFKEVEKDLDKYSSVIKTYEKRGDRENLREYLREYPERKRAIDYFNSVENGALKTLRQQSNDIARKYANEPAERKERLEENREKQNALMRRTTARVRQILGED